MRPTALPLRLLIVAAFALTTAACGGGGDDPRDPVGDPPSPDLEVISEGGGDPPPAVVGIELPAPVDGVVVLPGLSIPLTLRNASPDPVHAKLIADVQSNGAFHEVEVGTFDLEPGEVREISAALRILGINVDTLETPAAVGFRVVVDDPTGDPVDGFALPTYFVHRDGDDVVLFDESVLNERFDGILGAGDGDPDPETSPPDFSSGLQTICVHWKYHSLGHNAGEKYYRNAEPMAARGVKVTLGTQTLLTNRNNGCLAAAVPEGVFQIIVHAHAVIGVGHDIVVRAFELTNADQENDQLADSLERKWVFKALPNPQGAVHIYVPADDSSTMMAFGSFSAASLDALSPIPTQPNDPPLRLDLLLVPERVNSDAFEHAVAIAPSQKNIKFTYGHEVGHWYGLNSEFGAGSDYQVDTDDADCASNDGNAEHDHLLRSIEFNGAAFKEGMAHAFSTILWNGVGASAPRFRYYKNLDNLDAYNDLQADHYKVDMEANAGTPDPLGGVRAWRSAKCEGTNHAQRSVELDWARFFVNLLDPTSASGAAPTFAQLVKLLQLEQADLVALNDNAAYAYDIYPIMRSALSSDPELDNFLDRFTTLAETYDITP